MADSDKRSGLLRCSVIKRGKMVVVKALESKSLKLTKYLSSKKFLRALKRIKQNFLRSSYDHFAILYLCLAYRRIFLYQLFGIKPALT